MVNFDKINRQIVNNVYLLIMLEACKTSLGFHNLGFLGDGMADKFNSSVLGKLISDMVIGLTMSNHTVL